ncbi:MAG: hypothetical protein ACR2FN_01870 [Chitinophagaceae bacterium]
MRPPNRDLLVLTGKLTMSPQEFEHQIELLNDLLYHVENLNSFCTANEVIDVNRYKILYKPHIIQQIIRGPFKPFVFISNKN